MNCGEWVYKRALSYPERMFLKDNAVQFSNRAFNERVNRLAWALIDYGIQPGDRIGCLLENGSAFLELFFACAKTGTIMVPLNYRLAVPELLYMVNDSEPSIFFYSSVFQSTVEEMKKSNLEAGSCIRFDDEFFDDGSEKPFSASFPHEEPSLEWSVEGDAALIILYTSGTTGFPKGAVLTHNNMLFSAIHSLIGYGIDSSYKSLIAAPMFHIAALAAGAIPVLYAGGALVITRDFNPIEIMELIVSEKINYMFAIPVMYQLISQTRQWETADLSFVKFFIAGGAALPLPLIKKIQLEKGIYFAQGYGLTETARLSALDLEDSIRKAGSVGKEVFHVLLKIVDENDREVAPGQVGEIVARGPNVFSHYWNKPEETARSIRNGWFYTEDLGWRDSEGFLYIVGRKEEMILFSGENIYPIEVEKAIREFVPGVKDVAVLGKPDTKKGSIVTAFIQVKDNVDITKETIIKKLEGRIADFKIPRLIYFVDDFPRNAVGKILKRKLVPQFE